MTKKNRHEFVVNSPEGSFFGYTEKKVQKMSVETYVLRGHLACLSVF